jgi:hypothetical protein
MVARRSALAICLAILAVAHVARGESWYEKCFFILHEDHHIFPGDVVGRDADADETARLVALCKPDMIQMHAKGNPGWTTYPTKVGYAPPDLVRDVLSVWRDVARGGGYRFGVYFNLGNDGRIAANKPQWVRVGPDGKPLGRGMCFHSGVAQGYLWPMLREIIDTYHPDSLWFDGTAHSVCPCYCPACRARFDREKHLPPPAKNTDPGWADYQEMQRQIFREFIDQTIAEVHKRDATCLVGINNTYHLMMPEKPAAGLGYLTSDIGNQVEALSPLAHWFDAQGLPYDLMTKLVTADPRSVRDGTATAFMPKPAGQIQQEMAAIIANGGRFSLWDIPTPTGRLRREWIEVVARDVAPFLRARQPWCLGTRLPDVSVLHSAAAHYAATSLAAKTFVSHNIHVQGVVAALTPRHLNYEMLPDWRLAEQDVRSPLLIVEHPEAVSDEVVTGVLNFVNKGGHVLWSGTGLSARLQEVCGIRVLAEADKPEAFEVVGPTAQAKVKSRLLRVECKAAQNLLQAQTREGKRFPLLVSRAVGRGRMHYLAAPLMSRYADQSAPAALVDKILDIALPSAQRRLATDAPSSVEIVLREKNGQHVVHLVNMAAGKRTSTVAQAVVLYPGATSDGQTGIRPERLITDIPSAPPCRVVLRMERRPAAVTLQPQNQPSGDWQYEDGRLTVCVPDFAIHQMVVVKP